jgi:hypothetical protein
MPQGKSIAVDFITCSQQLRVKDLHVTGKIEPTGLILAKVSDAASQIQRDVADGTLCDNADDKMDALLDKLASLSK